MNRHKNLGEDFNSNSLRSYAIGKGDDEDFEARDGDREEFGDEGGKGEGTDSDMLAGYLLCIGKEAKG